MWTNSKQRSHNPNLVSKPLFLPTFHSPVEDRGHIWSSLAAPLNAWTIIGGQEMLFE